MTEQSQSLWEGALFPVLFHRFNFSTDVLFEWLFFFPCDKFECSPRVIPMGGKGKAEVCLRSRGIREKLSPLLKKRETDRIVISTLYWTQVRISVYNCCVFILRWSIFELKESQIGCIYIHLLVADCSIGNLVTNSSDQQLISHVGVMLATSVYSAKCISIYHFLQQLSPNSHQECNGILAIQGILWNLQQSHSNS